MNSKLKFTLTAVGALAAVGAALACYGRSRIDASVIAVCESDVRAQTHGRKVAFDGPVVKFIDSGEYLMYWTNLRVENAHGLMEQRKVMCSVKTHGWARSAWFIDGEPVRI